MVCREDYWDFNILIWCLQEEQEERVERAA
jgi:hypothetical protein